MTNGNLELVRSGIDAFNADGVEGTLPLIHPEFEATTPPELASEPDTSAATTAYGATSTPSTRRWTRSAGRRTPCRR